MTSNDGTGPEYEKMYRARITDRKTGESAITTEEASEFWWTEGNGSCDCNRQMYLRRAMAMGEDISSADVLCHYVDFPAGRFDLELVEPAND